jgi:glycine C-acetyltransferase
MKREERNTGGENFDLETILLRGRRLRLRDRVTCFGEFLGGLRRRGELTTMREIASAADREVMVSDRHSGRRDRMLMFGSNNYLGLANHPYVVERVRQAVARYGAGIGGPPLLNGFTTLHRELEQRLAELKGTDDAMVFPSGYGANVGLVTGLVGPDDLVLFDAYSHASFCDGIRMSGVEAHSFGHNDIDGLIRMLERQAAGVGGDIYIGAEGVYSMDGDLAPVDRLLDVCRTFGARLILDDAHGTGVMGPTGRGTAEHFGLEGRVDLTMGTFSKVFAVTGGFVAAEKPIIEYLRYFARSYMFSASLSPAVIAAVLAGLDVMSREPDLRARLHDNISYALSGLRSLGIGVECESGIIPLRVPRNMNIRRAARRFHDLGIFVNAVEYPAVPLSQQRFRISMMATHTRGDIDRLLDAVETVWAREGSPEEAALAPIGRVV